MARETREWHPNFLKYMEMIVKHPNYKGLPISKKDDGSYKWVEPNKESAVRKGRVEWATKKAKELGVTIQPGFYADVMLLVHPTKVKVCQTCGRMMSLYYLYPNAAFLKKINQEFNSDFSNIDNINDIWDELINEGFSRDKIADFLISSGNLNIPNTSSKKDIINELELACRKGGKACLGPGAMSNFPDRYDGFHTYNRCCRSSQDKGRSKDNLKSYTKDRRAYEYWSDGNIHAANQFMGSQFFKGTSADHVGPISLGFVHDSHYLQKMDSGANSSKRDRLQLIDIEKIIEIEKRTGIYPMSWYSSKIWEYILKNYKKNIHKIESEYRNALKQNMSNFMYILFCILTKCPKNGTDFLVKSFLEPNYKYFEYSYVFDEHGNILSKSPRHYTGRNENEMDRYTRIAIDSVFEYNEKSNRNTVPDLTNNEIQCLSGIARKIEQNNSHTYTEEKEAIAALINSIQKRIIMTL